MVGFLNRFYNIKIKCDNCGKDCEVRIRKGKEVVKAVKEGIIKCDNCGCVINPKEYQTQWLK